MAKVTELVAALAAPIAEQNGCTLWDVEYVREAGQWFLRVYIDKPEGISINDCEAVSRPLSDALDEADPIDGKLCAGGVLRRRRPPPEKARPLPAVPGQRRWMCASTGPWTAERSTPAC